jgi:hypothetical protein
LCAFHRRFLQVFDGLWYVALLFCCYVVPRLQTGVRVQVLDLNSNRLKHMGTLQGLQGCPRLRSVARACLVYEPSEGVVRCLSLYWNAVAKVPNFRQKMLQLLPTLLVLDKIVVNSSDFSHLNVFEDEHPESLRTVDVRITLPALALCALYVTLPAQLPQPPVVLQGAPAEHYMQCLKKTVYDAWGSRPIIALQRCLRGHSARKVALSFLRRKLQIRNALGVGLAVRALGGMRDGGGLECRWLIHL